MFNDLKKTFGRITPIDLINKELAEAELALLSAETAKDYADSIISYNTAKINRLKKRREEYSGLTISVKQENKIGLVKNLHS